MSMATDTYKGLDGTERPLEEHRAHLQHQFDQAVDPSSPRFDEGLVSKIRGELGALPPRAPRSLEPARHARASVTPKVVLVFDGPDAETIEAFLRAGPDAAHEIIASGRRKLKPSSLLRRVLRAVLAAKIERYP
jgi:hypothetical protein